MMDLFPDDNQTSPRSSRDAVLAHLLWYASRTLFILTVVFIGFAIKEPLDRFVARLAVTDSDRIRLQESLDRVKEMQTMYQRAQLANVRFLDLLHLAAHQTAESRELQRREFERQRAYTDAALEQLRATLFNRTHPMSEQVTAVAFDLIEDIDVGVIDADRVFQDRMNRPDLPRKTFEASAERARQLVRQLENLVFVETKNLDRRASEK